jgi:hypothetical protein
MGLTPRPRITDEVIAGVGVRIATKKAAAVKHATIFLIGERDILPILRGLARTTR